MAFVKIIEKKGTLDEATAGAGVLRARRQRQAETEQGAIKELIESLPTVLRAIKTGKVTLAPRLIPGIHPKLPGGAQDEVKAIYKHAEEHREEFNLYIKGEDEDFVEPEPDEMTDETLTAEAAAAADTKEES